MAITKISSFTREVWPNMDNHTLMATAHQQGQNRCPDSALNIRKFILNRGYAKAELEVKGQNMFMAGLNSPTVPAGQRFTVLYQSAYPNPFHSATVSQIISSAGGIGAGQFDLIILDFEAMWTNGFWDVNTRRNFAVYVQKLKQDNPNVRLQWYATFLELSSTSLPNGKFLKLSGSGQFATNTGGDLDFTAHKNAHAGTLSFTDWAGFFYDTPIPEVGNAKIKDFIDSGQFTGIGYDAICGVSKNDKYSIGYHVLGSLNGIELQKKLGCFPNPMVLNHHRTENGRAVFTRSYNVKTSTGRVKLQDKMFLATQICEGAIFMQLFNNVDVYCWHDNTVQIATPDFWDKWAIETAANNPNIFSTQAWHEGPGTPANGPYNVQSQMHDFQGGRSYDGYFRGVHLFSQIQSIANVGNRVVPNFQFRRGTHAANGSQSFGSWQNVVPPTNGGHYADACQNQFPIVEIKQSGSNYAVVFWDLFPNANSDTEYQVTIGGVLRSFKSTGNQISIFKITA